MAVKYVFVTGGVVSERELPLHLSGVFSKQEAIPLQCKNLIPISILIRER